MIGRLRAGDLIAAGPRSLRGGGPQIFVTTDRFLAVFGMDTLDDLPDGEGLEEAGLAGEEGEVRDRAEPSHVTAAG